MRTVKRCLCRLSSLILKYFIKFLFPDIKETPSCIWGDVWHGTYLISAEKLFKMDIYQWISEELILSYMNLCCLLRSMAFFSVELKGYVHKSIHFMTNLILAVMKKQFVLYDLMSFSVYTKISSHECNGDRRFAIISNMQYLH